MRVLLLQISINHNPSGGILEVVSSTWGYPEPYWGSCSTCKIHLQLGSGHPSVVCPTIRCLTFDQVWLGYGGISGQSAVNAWGHQHPPQSDIRTLEFLYPILPWAWSHSFLGLSLIAIYVSYWQRSESSHHRGYICSLHVLHLFDLHWFCLSHLVGQVVCLGWLWLSMHGSLCSQHANM